MSHAVLMSEPPQRSNAQPQTLYKGVMLSTRPAGVAGNANGQKPPFIAAGHVETRAGYPPIQKVKNVGALRRKKRNPAIKKHKKWLEELQLEKTKFLEEQEKLDERNEIRLQNFKDRSAFIRRRICNSVKGEESELTVEEAERLFSEPLWKLKQGEPSDEAVKRPSRPWHKSKSKPKATEPAWKRTEAQNEEFEEEEVSELLSFAENLDFETYLNDLEVRELISNVKKRVAILNGKDVNFKSTTAATVAREQSSNEDGVRPLVPKLNIGEGDDAADREEEEVEEDVEEGEDKTERIVKESREMKDSFKKVHSKNSLRNVVKSVGDESKISLEAIPDPVIVIADSHTGTGRSQQDKVKAHVETLPYLHRNPAV